MTSQPENECALEITEQGKTLCCDCLYIENHPDATCHRCETKLYSKTLVFCGGGWGECETWYCATCHADGTHDCPVCGDDDETVSVESEDTCECCGRPYDHRNPHRQSEMCDCVQNDDGTLSRPKEEDEESIPDVKDCGHFFDCGCGMTVCGECDEDMCDNEACAIYYTYRNDACMCDGCDFCEWKIRIRKSGLKLTPPFIPE